MSVHLTEEPIGQSWQAYETSTGTNTSKKIDLEEVVKKKHPMGKILPDGTFDDEDPEAKIRQAKRQFWLIMAVSCFILAAYMFSHLLLFGVEACEEKSENRQTEHLRNESHRDSGDS